jgi:hypothetical protein
VGHPRRVEIAPDRRARRRKKNQSGGLRRRKGERWDEGRLTQGNPETEEGKGRREEMTGRPRFPVEAAAGAGGGGASGERAALVVSTPLPSVRRAGHTGKQYRRWNEDPQRSEWRDGARGHGAWSVCAFLSVLIIYLFFWFSLGISPSAHKVGNLESGSASHMRT